MLTVIEACAREAVTHLPDIDDTPVKRRKIEYKVLFFWVCVNELVIYRIGSQNQWSVAYQSLSSP